MTDSLFFDTDCLSAFLWVERESLLTQLYPGKVVIPKPVYDELSYPGVAFLRAGIDALLSDGQARVAGIDTGTDAYDLYYRLTAAPGEGRVVIGKGEAASIALSKAHGGIVASNNLRDIGTYIEELGLKHTTTGDILAEAYKKGHITGAQGNALWTAMLAKRRRLGAKSFSDYLERM